MQSLKAACEEAEHILHIAKKCPRSVPHYQEKNGKTFFSIHQKLRELYEEECARDSHQPNKHLRSCSHLLDKLVKREHLNTLIVNLYPGNKGYSIGIRIHSKSGGGSSSNSHHSSCAGTSTMAGTSSSSNSNGGATESIIETVRWPYQEDELLRYIDNEELPPVVVDLLEASNPELFYSGCIIAEVRDYRQAFQHYIYDAHHVLLRPTTQSLLCDVNLMTDEGEWNAEDRLALESQLVLATQGPLCLDPSPAVSVVSNHMQYHRHALNTQPLRRCAKKFSQVAVNRKRKLDQYSVHHDVQLYDFITRRRAKTHSLPLSNSRLLKKPCENGLLVPPPTTPLDSKMPDLTVPEGGVDVMRFARVYERPRETNDCSPQLVEEYILESEGPEGKINHIKLSILQRPSNAEYLGELYVDRDYREKEENGTSCKFFLGTRVQANRYIQQFTEIFTEEGRKSVRITHIVPGQPTRVTCTSSMRDRNARVAQQAQVQAQHFQAQAQQLQSQTPVHNPVQIQNQQTVPQQNQLLQVSSHIQSSPNVHLQLQASNHIPPQQIQSQIQVQNQQPQNHHIHAHQPQVLSLSNSVVSPPPVTNITSVTNLSNSSINNLSSVTPANIMNGTVVAPNVAGSSSVVPNVTNSLTSLSTAVGMGVGVSSVAGITSQNSIKNGSAPSLTSQHQPQIQSSMQPAPSQVQKSSSSGTRHITNPAISALVTSLMNSAQQFQQQAAAAAAATAAAQTNSSTPAASNTVPVSSTTSGTGSSVANSVQVTSSSNNAAMLSLLNISQPTVASSNTNVNPATAQAISQKLLARKMTLNLLSSRLMNHSTLPNNSVTSGNTLVQNNSTGQQQQQPVRVTLSSLASQLAASPATTTPPSQTQQAITISSNNPGLTTLQASNMGFSSVPISTPNAGANKATSQQAVSLNHSSRLLNSSPATRRLSVTSLGNTAADTNTSAIGSNLGLSMPGLSALLAGTPSADNPIPGSGNSASSLLERLTASSATSGTNPPSPYTPLPSSSPNTQPFSSPSSKSQFLSQSPSPKNQQQQQQTHFPSPSPKPPATPSPLSSPPQSSVNLNLQGLSLASLQGAMASIPGLQNVQVSIPGLPVPISLSLNVSTSSAHSAGVIVTTLPVTTTTVTCTTTTSMASSSAVSATSPLGPAGSNSPMVLTNTTPGTGSVLSLPVVSAQLMTSNVKNMSQQNVRTPGPTASVSVAQGGGSSGGGSGGSGIQFVGLQRPRGLVTANQLSAAGNKQALAARQIVSTQRHTVKMAPPNAGPAQIAASSLASGNQVVTLTAQQQLQLALQKQAQFQQLCLNQQSLQQQQKPTVSPASVASRHRRRSNTADPSK